MSESKIDPISFGEGFRAGVKHGAIHAHWVKFGGAGMECSNRWQCSACKRTATAETYGKYCEYERCPHCGAIMDDNGEK